MGEPGLAGPNPSSSSLVRAGSFTTEDPCAHEQATAPWDNVVTPLSRGPYGQIVHFLASPGLTLYREHKPGARAATGAISIWRVRFRGTPSCRQ
jgi:hypothetical protein